MKNSYIPYNKKLVEVARVNRKNPTEAEKKIWNEIFKNKHFKNYRFLRQKPLDNFVVDFYCPELMLVIEIDGDSHLEKQEYDELRSERLKNYGIKVIRYTNDEIMYNIGKVYKDLKEKINPSYILSLP